MAYYEFLLMTMKSQICASDRMKKRIATTDFDSGRRPFDLVAGQGTECHGLERPGFEVPDASVGITFRFWGNGRVTIRAMQFPLVTIWLVATFCLAPLAVIESLLFFSVKYGAIHTIFLRKPD